MKNGQKESKNSTGKQKMNSHDNFEIEFEWQDPCGARGEELRATWASLSILFDHEMATELLDGNTKSVRNKIFLPLFPLAEWIADNWWFLQSEVARSTTAECIEFDRRHNLRWARDGYVLPALRIVSLGESVLAQWQPVDYPDAKIRFLSSGETVLPAGTVFDKLREFVKAVIGRLDESDIGTTSLHEQWQAIENANSEEREFCLASARMGVDPYALDKASEKLLLETVRNIRPEILNDLLSLATLDCLQEMAGALRSGSESIKNDDDRIDALEGIRNHRPSLLERVSPWERAYQFAIDLRKQLNGSNWKSRSLHDLAGHLYIDKIDHCFLDINAEIEFLDVLIGNNKFSNPKLILKNKKKRPDSQQFAFCRALFELLTLPTEKFSIVSSLRTNRQQMNRAFAAEFLAPHEMLKKDLSSETIGEEEIEDLAADYGVSAFVIRHQIENHKLARIAV